MNNYAKAIQILSCAHVDFRSLAYEIAMKNPKALVSAYERQQPDLWKHECKLLIDAGKKIDAIKLCRTFTGLGLKEAKEVVESL